MAPNDNTRPKKKVRRTQKPKTAAKTTGGNSNPVLGVWHCQKCQTVIRIRSDSFPLRLRCPKCKKGWLLKTDRPDIRWLKKRDATSGETESEPKASATPTGPVKCELIVIGDGAVGKTSLIKRYVHDEFDNKYLTTIGNKLSTKTTTVTVDGDERTVEMTLWDVSDQKDDHESQDQAYEKADGALLVCDILRKDTLQSLQDYWFPNLSKKVGRIPIVFAANKADLLYGTDYSMEELEMIILSSDEVERVIKKYDAPFFRTSALNGENVSAAIGKLTELIVSRQ